MGFCGARAANQGQLTGGYWPATRETPAASSRQSGE